MFDIIASLMLILIAFLKGIVVSKFMAIGDIPWVC